jgi:hypothetical protein
MKGLMWKNLTTLLVSVSYEKANCSVVDAINNGRTNPGVLVQFSQLGK